MIVECEIVFHDATCFVTTKSTFLIADATMIRPEILLHPQIPPPLHGLAPRVVMGRKWWDKKRREAYDKYDQKCHCCGIHKTKAKYKKLLEGHEAYEIDWGFGRVQLEEIVALCHSCHNYIHRGLMEVLVSLGKMPEGKMQDILSHGSKIIQEAGLTPSSIPEEWASWSRWVLIIDGIEHPGRFSSEEEWHSYYQWLNTTGRKDSAAMLEAFHDGL
jgi:hypothetical protein